MISYHTVLLLYVLYFDEKISPPPFVVVDAFSLDTAVVAAPGAGHGEQEGEHRGEVRVLRKGIPAYS